MKKSKLFISETYADQARAALRCDRLCSELTGVLFCCAGAVPAAVPAARAGARVPDPQAHLLDPRQDEEPRDQHAHQGPHQDRHALSARHRCRAAGCLGGGLRFAPHALLRRGCLAGGAAGLDAVVDFVMMLIPNASHETSSCVMRLLSSTNA